MDKLSKFAVLCFPKNKDRRTDPPCLDPLDYGRGEEPNQHLLLRRGRIALFPSREDAEQALRRTGKECVGHKWQNEFSFIIMEAIERGGDDVPT